MSDKAHQLPEAQAPLGDKLDTELLTVSSVQVLRQRIQLCGAGDVETAIAAGGTGGLAINSYGVGFRRLANRSALQTFVSAVVFNNTNTQDLSSTEFVCGPYQKAILYVDAAIAGNPTAINIGLDFADVFSSPTSTDWHLHLAERVRITDFTIQRIALELSSPGQMVRTRLDSEGTTATDTITVTLTAEFFS
jgi:hypothetical protein